MIILTADVCNHRNDEPHHVQAQGVLDLDALCRFLFVQGASARSGLGLDELVVAGLRAMESLLEDGLRLVELEFGLEVDLAIIVAAAVGATTRVGEVELIIDDLLADSAPVWKSNVSNYAHIQHRSRG